VFYKKIQKQLVRMMKSSVDHKNSELVSISNTVTIQCLKLRVPKMPKDRMQYIYIQYDFDSFDHFFIFFPLLLL